MSSKKKKPVLSPYRQDDNCNSMRIAGDRYCKYHTDKCAHVITNGKRCRAQSMYFSAYCRKHVPPIRVGAEYQAEVEDYKDDAPKPKPKAKGEYRTIIQVDPVTKLPHEIGYWYVGPDKDSVPDTLNGKKVVKL